MILELKDICKTYEQGTVRVPALKNVNLSVDKGEYVAIMGPSGSGKSTLMNIIGCLDMPSSGAFFLDGLDMMKQSDNSLSDIRCKKIGFVFQSFQLLPGENALQNVMLPLSFAKVPRHLRKGIAENALSRVGLSDRMNFMPNQLSGGQKQRVAIARALVNDPEILLADEPTGALDQKTGAEVMELFKKLNEEGVTILMITHDRHIAANAKRVMYIVDGELGDTAPEGIEAV